MAARSILLNFFLIFRFSVATWNQLVSDSTSSTTLAPRFGTITLVLNDTIAISGGCSSSCCYAPLSDTWIYQNNVWTNVSQSTILPSSRLYHSSSPISSSSSSSSSFFVFGGTDIVNGELNDLWKVTFQSQSYIASWEEITISGTSIPEARSGQSQNEVVETSDIGSFVIFGGESATAILGDVWVYSSAKNIWSEILFSNGNDGPKERTQHASSIVSLSLSPNSILNALIISGGSGSDGNDSNDIWLLPLISQSSWLFLGQGVDNLPSVRHGHSMWISSSSSSSSSTTSESESESITEIELMFFAGQNCSFPDPNNFLNDIWKFTVSLTVTSDGKVSLTGGQEGTFTLIDNGSGIAPNPRTLGGLGQLQPTSSSKYGNGAVIYSLGFSGYNGGTDDRLHNDLWVYTTNSSTST
jgi:hypothetical protein